MDTEITNNVIRNSAVGTENINANCVIAEIDQLSILDVRMAISDNYFETTTETSGIKIGEQTDPEPTGVFYIAHNTARINTGESDNPLYHTVNVTKIRTYPPVYTALIGDIAYYPYAETGDIRISDTEIGTYKKIPFSATKTIGYALNADGAIILPSAHAYYKVEYNFNARSFTEQTVDLIIGGQPINMVLPGSGMPTTISGTLYIDDNSLGGQPLGVLARAIATVDSISGVIRLFRIS